MPALPIAAPALLRRAGRPRLAWPAARSGRALAALCGLLAGCVTPPQGLPRPGPAAADHTGPRARLLLRGAVPGDDKFALVALTDAVHCKNPRLLSSGNARQPPEPASLPAGVLSTVDFVVLRADKINCGVCWTFTPEAGKTYLVQGVVVGGGCTGRLLDVTDSAKPQPAAGAVLRSGPGQACLALDQSRPAGDTPSLIQGGQHLGEAVLNPAATARDLQGLIRP